MEGVIVIDNKNYESVEIKKVPLEIKDPLLAEVTLFAEQQRVAKQQGDAYSSEKQDNEEMEHIKKLQEKALREEQKMLENIRIERSSQVIAPIIVKSLISGGIIYWIMTRSDGYMGVLETIYGFLMFYLICSIFHFSLLLTRNYILAIILTVAIPFIASALGIDDLLNRIFVGPVGQEILVGMFLATPVAIDIFRIVRMAKINKKLM